MQIRVLKVCLRHHSILHHPGDVSIRITSILWKHSPGNIQYKPRYWCFYSLLLIRKQSVSGGNGCSAFEQATLQLEALCCEETCAELSVEQINAITEPIILLAERQEDLMNLAKRASRQLYCDFTGNTRSERINLAVNN